LEVFEFFSMAVVNRMTDSYGAGFVKSKDEDVMSTISTEDVSTSDNVSSVDTECDSSCPLECISPSTVSVLGEVGAESFSFLDNLGEGAFGQVFLAQHKATGGSYAMKAVNLGATEAIDSANAERMALGRVGPHPYIVRLFASFETKTRSVLVLEYCSGGDLQHLITWEGRLSEPLTRLYAAEVLLALGHVHKHGLAFRDLKPENVLLDAAGHVRLADFGLASPDQASEELLVVGTPAFMAPEILEGHAESGRLADIYGLGVLVFNMLSGSVPFTGKSRKKLFENICSAPITFPAKFGGDHAKDFVSRLMERNPTQRLGSSQTEFVQYHPFFADIDFEALTRQEVPVPVTKRSSIFSRIFGSAA
jgi:serine/threonine protein kinase